MNFQLFVSDIGVLQLFIAILWGMILKFESHVLQQPPGEAGYERIRDSIKLEIHLVGCHLFSNRFSKVIGLAILCGSILSCSFFAN